MLVKSILIATLFLGNATLSFANKSFEDIWFNAKDLIGESFEITGIISPINPGLEIIDINESTYHFGVNLNFNGETEIVKKQKIWLFNNCGGRDCIKKMKIKILNTPLGDWQFKYNQSPTVQIIKVDSPQINYELNYDDVDLTALLLYPNELKNKRIIIDLFVEQSGTKGRAVKSIIGNQMIKNDQHFFFHHKININFKESKQNLQKKYKLITKCKGTHRDPYNRSWSQKDLPNNCFFSISALYEFSRGQYKIYEKGWWETNLVDAKIINHIKFSD